MNLRKSSRHGSHYAWLRTASHAAIVISTLATAGCTTWQTTAPVQPTSYKTSSAVIDRQAGKLRRLLLIPVEIPPPEKCSDPKGDWKISDSTAGAEFVLSLQLDYEVVVAKEDTIRGLTGAGDQAIREQVSALYGSLQAFSPVLPQPQPPQQAARALGQALQTDGVLLLEMSHFCLPALSEPSFDRLLLGIYTFGLSEIIIPLAPPTATHLYTRLKAALFETASGQLVWYSCPRCHIATIGPREQFENDTSAELFETLDMAVPKLLTR